MTPHAPRRICISGKNLGRQVGTLRQQDTGSNEQH